MINQIYIIYTKSSTKSFYSAPPAPHPRRTSVAIKFGINQQNFSPSTRQRNRSSVNPSYLETKGRLIVGTYASLDVTRYLREILTISHRKDEVDFTRAVITYIKYEIGRVIDR